MELAVTFYVVCFEGVRWFLGLTCVFTEQNGERKIPGPEKRGEEAKGSVSMRSGGENACDEACDTEGGDFEDTVGFRASLGGGDCFLRHVVISRGAWRCLSVNLQGG